MSTLQRVARTMNASAASPARLSKKRKASALPKRKSKTIKKDASADERFKLAAEFLSAYGFDNSKISHFMFEFSKFKRSMYEMQMDVIVDALFTDGEYAKIEWPVTVIEDLTGMELEIMDIDNKPMRLRIWKIVFATVADVSNHPTGEYAVFIDDQRMLVLGMKSLVTYFLRDKEAFDPHILDGYCPAKHANLSSLNIPEVKLIPLCLIPGLRIRGEPLVEDESDESMPIQETTDDSDTSDYQTEDDEEEVFEARANPFINLAVEVVAEAPVVTPTVVVSAPFPRNCNSRVRGLISRVAGQGGAALAWLAKDNEEERVNRQVAYRSDPRTKEQIEEAESNKVYKELMDRLSVNI